MQRTHRFSGVMARRAPLVLAFGALLGMGKSARAVEDLPEPDVTAEARPVRSGPANVLPQAVSARVNDDRVTATDVGAGMTAANAPPR